MFHTLHLRGSLWVPFHLGQVLSRLQTKPGMISKSSTSKCLVIAACPWLIEVSVIEVPSSKSSKDVPSTNNFPLSSSRLCTDSPAPQHRSAAADLVHDCAHAGKAVAEEQSAESFALKIKLRRRLKLCSAGVVHCSINTLCPCMNERAFKSNCRTPQTRHEVTSSMHVWQRPSLSHLNIHYGQGYDPSSKT